jgi:hypothetical protein
MVFNDYDILFSGYYKKIILENPLFDGGISRMKYI